MEAQNENVKEISKMIGISNKKVISQAMEYIRLLKIKTNFNMRKKEYATVVICLDISATKSNENFNLDKGLQLTKYGRAKYRIEKNTIIRVLNLAEAPNIKSICNALQLKRTKDVERRATQILVKLKKSKSNLLGEFGHPQNPSMAVYYACQFLTVKVDERKLIAVSRLQRSQWTQLKTLWRPFLVDCIDVSTADTTKESTKSLPLTRKTKDRQNLPPNPVCVVKTEPIESYDVWKKRILSKAYADLALQKRKIKRCKKNTKK